MKYLLATDVGSTTTKARLFARNEEGHWRFLVSGEAPTTVEAPYEDVTMGVRNAVREVEELTQHHILSEDGRGITVPCSGNVGVDLYCTTSSAGGGLQMMVAGVIKTMTAESANRAALGAGAIVMDVIAVNDGRRSHEKIRRIRNLRPDMILLAGGTDGGTDTHVMMIAELIRASDPKPRLGASYRLPLIYAGNKQIRPQIEQMLGKDFALTLVDNIRPVLEIEHTEPARQAIHELFMEHVMSHAPGYTKLMEWTDVKIMPTPAAEGMAMQLIAKTFNMNVLGVGLGGATTNVYSIFEGKFARSVSANLGMSYSICNVMKEAGTKNVLRWLPFKMEDDDLRSRLRNKMIRPTTIPQTLDELIMEHAVAREALRLGLLHHKSIASRLKGVKISRTIGDLFQQELQESYIDMMKIDIIASTGGLLSHAPKREQTMVILIDAFQPEGITRMFQDSVFMMPHLGVLSTVYPEAAWEIFDKDCLIRLGTVIAPKGLAKSGDEVMSVHLEMSSGEEVKETVAYGEMKHINLPVGAEAKVSVEPRRGFDMGKGSGNKIEGTVMGGQVGIVLDGRGRPIQLAEDSGERRNALLKWLQSFDVYPKEKLDRLLEGSEAK
jgi:uncharacterized protein (TIGR01319 family)